MHTATLQFSFRQPVWGIFLCQSPLAALSIVLNSSRLSVMLNQVKKIEQKGRRESKTVCNRCGAEGLDMVYDNEAGSI